MRKRRVAGRQTALRHAVRIAAIALRSQKLNSLIFPATVIKNENFPLTMLSSASLAAIFL